MTSKDTDFLKKRIAQSTQPVQSTVTTTDTSVIDNANTFLEDVTADTPDTTLSDKDYNARLRLAKLRKRAEMADAADQEKAARLQAKQDEKDAQAELDEREEQERTQAEAIRRVTTRTISGIGDQTGAIADRVGTLPTYGGIGMLIALLVILLFTVVRVNEQGDTRLKQFWYMLNGRATIKGRQTVASTTVASTTGQPPQVIDTTGGVPIKPDGSCPPGYHGAMANGQLFCQPDNKSVTTPTNSGGAPPPDLTHSATDLGF